MNKKFISVMALSSLLFSCAKTDEQKIDSARQEAMYHLTAGDCDKAKDALDDVTADSDDALYVSLYASVYECKAGYTELDTVIGNLTSLNASAAGLFSSLASFTSSQEETAADSTSYTNILNALKVILASSSTVSATARIAKFGVKKGGDLNYQALFLVTIALGKYMAFYGDAGTNGAKGGGGSHNCLAQYTDATALGHLALNGGDSCASGSNTSSTETLVANSAYQRRLCEGVVLYNNFLDLLANISFPGDASELGDLVNTETVLNTLLSTAEAVEVAVGTYKVIKSFSTCETTAASDATGLQRHFAILMENSYN